MEWKKEHGDPSCYGDRIKTFWELVEGDGMVTDEARPLEEVEERGKGTGRGQSQRDVGGPMIFFFDIC